MLSGANRIENTHRRRDWLAAGASYIEGEAAARIFAYMLRVASALSEHSEAFEWLVPLLAARNRAIRAKALEALMGLARNPNLRPTARHLVPIFEASSVQQANALAIELLKRLSSFPRWDYASLLPHLVQAAGGEQVARAAEALEDSWIRVRTWRQLASLGHLDGDAAVEKLRAELSRSEGALRGSAAVALLELSPASSNRPDFVEEALEALVAAEDDILMFGNDPPSRRELLDSVTGLLSGRELSLLLDKLDQLVYADEIARVISAIVPKLDGEDLDEVVIAAREIPFPAQAGEVLAACVKRMCELGRPEEAMRLSESIGHPGWQVKAQLDPAIALATRPSELIAYLRRAVALPTATYTSVSQGAFSQMINTGWQEAAARRILEVLRSTPSDQEQAIETIIARGSPSVYFAVVAEAVQCRASRELAGLAWQWMLDAPMGTRAALIAGLTRVDGIARILCPDVQMGDLGEAVLDNVTRWP